MLNNRYIDIFKTGYNRDERRVGSTKKDIEILDEYVHNRLLSELGVEVNSLAGDLYIEKYPKIISEIRDVDVDNPAILKLYNSLYEKYLKNLALFSLKFGKEMLSSYHSDVKIMTCCA